MIIAKTILPAIALFLAFHSCSDAFERTRIKFSSGITILSQMDNDTCAKCNGNPFCACVCCASQFHLSSPLQIDFAVIERSSEGRVLYIEKLVPSNNSSIWLPPRI